MQIIIGKTFKKTRIVLDNKHFSGCEIDDCLLLYSGKQFKITDTKMTDVQVQFSGAAECTICLLSQFKIDPQELLKNYNAQKELDLMMKGTTSEVKH